jgi:hypothetical protein
MKLVPKNWTIFQHYKDRCPPWVKLHRELLNDKQFMCLPVASKALAPLLWLLASESKTGEFDGSIEELVFRLRFTVKEVEAGLKPLIDKGFFLSASGVLADCLQGAIPETETEREERERQKQLALDVKLGFVEFWKCYPKKIAKPNAEKAWMKIAPDVDLSKRIIHAISEQKLLEREEQFIPYPASWLNARRWEDDLVAGKSSNGLKYWEKGYQS